MSSLFFPKLNGLLRSFQTSAETFESASSIEEEEEGSLSARDVIFEDGEFDITNFDSNLNRKEANIVRNKPASVPVGSLKKRC